MNAVRSINLATMNVVFECADEYGGENKVFPDIAHHIEGVAERLQGIVGEAVLSMDERDIAHDHIQAIKERAEEILHLYRPPVLIWG